MVVVINFNNTYVTLELRLCVDALFVATAAVVVAVAGAGTTVAGVVAAVGEVAEEESGFPLDFIVDELLDFFKLDVPEYSYITKRSIRV